MRSKRPIKYCEASVVSACSGRQETKTHCSKHYDQVRIHGKAFTTRFDRRRAVIDGDVAKIPLGIGAKDGYALVDAKDVWVEKYNWSKSTNGYAQARVNGGRVLMHTLLLGKTEGYEIDHANINQLDNRRSNLKLVTHGENMYNLPTAKNNTSGVRGVSFENRKGKWVAQIQLNYKNKFLGYYDSIKEAKKARLNAEKQLFVYSN